VLERRCEQCELEVGTLDRDELGSQLRANAAAWRKLLGRGSIVHRRPPSPTGEVIWSAVEYGAHVRDVYARFLDRLQRMLKDKNPEFPDWDQNHEAVTAAYAEADPGQVGYDLAVTAGRVADIVDRIRGKKWDRRGTRSDGDTFTVESITRYMIHDVVHHLADAEAGFAAINKADNPDEVEDSE